MKGVYSAVRTGYLNKAVCASSVKVNAMKIYFVVKLCDLSRVDAECWGYMLLIFSGMASR